jgi:hypothetical protein
MAPLPLLCAWPNCRFSRVFCANGSVCCCDDTRVCTFAEGNSACGCATPVDVDDNVRENFPLPGELSREIDDGDVGVRLDGELPRDDVDVCMRGSFMVCIRSFCVYAFGYDVELSLADSVITSLEDDAAY